MNRQIRLNLHAQRDAVFLRVAGELDYAPNMQALNLVTGKTMMVALVVRKTTQQFAGDAWDAMLQLALKVAR